MKYVSITFLILLISVIYFHSNNINKLTLSALCLFLLYLILCQQYYENFDKSLDYLIQTTNENFSSNDKLTTNIANQIIANRLYNNTQPFDIDKCITELIKGSILDGSSSFNIKKNNKYLTISNNISQERVYLTEKLLNSKSKYPPFEFNIEYVNKALNRKTLFDPICSFKI